MSDGNSIGRRQLLTAGVAGVVGAAAGFMVGRQQEPNGGDTPRSEERGAPFAEFNWRITVQGGYGWLFAKDSAGKPNVTLLALKREECCSSECLPHDMKLITMPRFVDVDHDPGCEPQSKGSYLYWDLAGAVEFSRGMPRNGIIEPPRTDWNAIQDPWKPENPNEPIFWDDQVWLPERQKARPNVEKYSSAHFRITDGELAVAPPNNAAARAGRWVFGSANERVKALTDILTVSGKAQDVIAIRWAQGEVRFRPKRRLLPLWIRHAVRLDPTPVVVGYKPEHYVNLFQFVDAGNGQPPACSDVEVPSFEKRSGLVQRQTPSDDLHKMTPGDLCPPLPLEGP